MDSIPRPFVASGHSSLWTDRLSQVPKRVFVDASLFEEELRRIFYGDIWHPVGHAAEIPNPGDFKTFWLGRMPVLMTRAQDGEIRVFFNSCSHRGAQLETGSHGNRPEFECPYHRWSYDARGRLIGCPGQKEFSPEFDPADFGLRSLRSAEFLGMICVTLGEATPPLEAWLGEAICETLKNAWGGDGRLQLLGYQKARYTANWKAYNDNDGYHAPLLHSAFRLLNAQAGAGGQVPMPNGNVCMHSELRPLDNNSFLQDPSLVAFKGADPKNGSSVIELFPLTVIVKHIDAINLRFAIPRSHDETEVHYAYFAHADDDAAMRRHRLRQSSNLLGPSGVVSMEDAAVFERLHVGAHTPGFAEFQKGVGPGGTVPAVIRQNDESGLIPKWEYYRRLMGFERPA